MKKELLLFTILALFLLIWTIGVSAETECTDSDGGKNYETKGTISPPVTSADFDVEIAKWNKSEDSCALIRGENSEAVSSCSGMECSLLELYCVNDNPDQRVFFQYKDCPNGCQNGTCIQEPEETPCTDTDNGKDYYTKGTFSGMYDYDGTLIPLTNTDSCITTPDELGDDVDSSNYLGEGYCENNQLKIERITCPNGCQNGTCIQEEACDGCLKDGNCYPAGIRKTGEYCSGNKEWEKQKLKGICENNFECESNLCVDTECIELSIWQKFWNWFMGLFEGFFGMGG